MLSHQTSRHKLRSNTGSKVAQHSIGITNTGTTGEEITTEEDTTGIGIEITIMTETDAAMIETTAITTDDRRTTATTGDKKITVAMTGNQMIETAAMKMTGGVQDFLMTKNGMSSNIGKKCSL